MVFSIGEALIDIKDGKEFFGGCPLNVALALSRLNTSATFVGGVSSDRYGNEILNFIIDNCIIFDPSFCSRPEYTMTSVVKTENGKEEYCFNYKNSSALFMDQNVLEGVYNNNSDVEAVFFGSVTYSDNKAGDVILKFLDNHKNLIGFFDPNVRTQAIEDFDGYIKSLIKAFKIADFVKMSDEDLREIGMSEKEVFDMCKHHLIITSGNRGATWYSKDFGFDAPVHSDGISVDVKDTIGCGDCFSGAVLHWLDINKKFSPEGVKLSLDEIHQALFFAVCSAAVNASREGCNPPTMEDLQ